MSRPDSPRSIQPAGEAENASRALELNPLSSNHPLNAERRSAPSRRSTSVDKSASGSLDKLSFDLAEPASISAVDVIRGQIAATLFCNRYPSECEMKTKYGQLLLQTQQANPPFTAPAHPWYVCCRNVWRFHFALAMAPKCRWCGNVLLSRHELQSLACSDECEEMERFAAYCGV
jgi:hypothetical protein